MKFAWPSPLNVIRRIWVCFPVTIRVAVYRLLLSISKWWYPNSFKYVQKTPFGVYIKWGTIYRGHYRVREHEAAALQLVEAHTSIPAPRLIDYAKTDRFTFLVMTKVPGEPAYYVVPTLDKVQKTTLSADLRSAILQLRRIPNTHEHAICNSIGGEVKDVRLWKDRAGPFHNKAELNKYTCQHMPPVSAEIAEILSRQHKIYFSHADLNTTNVMIKDGKFSGLVDFDFAGWWPEYWEYTKALYIRYDRPMWQEIIEGAFTEDYSQEFYAEEQLLEHTRHY